MSFKDVEPTGECNICFCEIDADTFCQYKVHEDDTQWTPSPVCTDCITYLQTTQWNQFLELVDKADCRAAVLRLCQKVPLTVHDNISFKCATHGDDCSVTPQGSIALLWKKVDDSITTPVLDNAKQGEDRDIYIKDLQEFAEFFEKEKEDESSS